MNKAPGHRASSVGYRTASCESDNDCKELSAFDYNEANHGWTKCFSHTYPGKSYYFNVDSCCVTWARPVSKLARTRVSKTLHLSSAEDLDEAPINVSDIEDSDDDAIDLEIQQGIKQENNNDEDPKKIIKINAKREREKQIYADVLFKLYHCYGDDWNHVEPEKVALPPIECKTEIPEEDTDEEFAAIIPETCYSSDGNDDQELFATIVSKENKKSETSDDHERFNDLTHGTSIDDEYSENSDAELGDKISIVSTSHSENSNNSSRKLNDYKVDENSRGNFKNPRGDENRSYGLPRLKVIEFSDLLTGPIKDPTLRKKKPKKRKAPIAVKTEVTDKKPKIMTTIIRELNGIKTVNYDYIEPDLPFGIKMDNLSDSGSSTCHDNWYAQGDNVNNKIPDIKPKIEENIEVKKELSILDYLMNFGNPDLSDTSDSGSSTQSRIRKREIVKNSVPIHENSESSESDSNSGSSSSSSSSSSSDWKSSESDGSWVYNSDEWSDENVCL